MYRINIKPLSANRAWRGQRFKTPEYSRFSQEMAYKLPPKVAIPEGLLELTLMFGLSNPSADGDNCIKQAQDAIAKKYGFNDKRIFRWVVEKVPVAKGDEFIAFSIYAIPQTEQMRGAA